MTVATSLDSLLEKLKVKELYLRPSNWDYLHSQSRQFLPPTRASPPSSSSVFFAVNTDNLRGVTVEVQKFEEFKCLNASYVPVLK
uniref:Uncharacterized protein n=1 Tax=Brassica campestris TaxID=3711 RepID=M4FEQ4_BRACM